MRAHDGFYGGWVQVEGTAEIVERPEAVELLVDYYRRLAGEHADWDDYRRAMVEERRVLVRFEIERASGSLTELSRRHGARTTTKAADPGSRVGGPRRVGRLRLSRCRAGSRSGAGTRCRATPG